MSENEGVVGERDGERDKVGQWGRLQARTLIELRIGHVQIEGHVEFAS